MAWLYYIVGVDRYSSVFQNEYFTISKQASKRKSQFRWYHLHSLYYFCPCREVNKDRHDNSGTSVGLNDHFWVDMYSPRMIHYYQYLPTIISQC